MLIVLSFVLMFVGSILSNGTKAKSWKPILIIVVGIVAYGIGFGTGIAGVGRALGESEHRTWHVYAIVSGMAILAGILAKVTVLYWNRRRA